MAYICWLGGVVVGWTKIKEAKEKSSLWVKLKKFDPRQRPGTGLANQGVSVLTGTL